MPPKKSSLGRAQVQTYQSKRKRTSTANVEDRPNEVVETTIAVLEPPKRKGRGPGKIRPSTTNENEKPEIWPVGQHEFDTHSNPSQISSTITKLALNNMPGPHRSFNQFDTQSKQLVEDLFLERFRYRVGENPGHCRQVFEAIARKRYSEELHRARQKCFNKFGMDVEAWKRLVPHWCTNHDVWTKLCDIFATEGWKGLSKQNKLNRLKAGISASHFAGSASSHQHTNKLKLKLGREPTQSEVYLHLHVARHNGKSPIENLAQASVGITSANEEADYDNAATTSTIEDTNAEGRIVDTTSMQWASNKSKDIYDKVKEMQHDPKYADTDETSLFFLASGGRSHGRTFGFGSKFHNKTTTPTSREGLSYTGASSASELTETEPQRTFTRTEVESLLKERDGRHASVTAQMEKRYEENAMLIAHMYEKLGMHKPSLHDPSPTSDTLQGGIERMQTSNLEDDCLPSRVPHTQAFGMQIPTTQGLPPLGYGGMQALLHEAQNGHDLASSEAAMDTWFENGNV